MRVKMIPPCGGCKHNGKLVPTSGIEVAENQARALERTGWKRAGAEAPKPSKKKKESDQ